MADIVLTGDTSGAITVAAPAVAGTNTITLPAETGTIVTSTSAATNTPAFAVTIGSNQTLSETTATKAEFDTIIFDTDNAFNTSTYEFTVPTGAAGKYQINGLVRVDSEVGANLSSAIFYLYKNGSIKKRMYQYYTSNYIRAIAISMSTILDLEVGDYLSLYAYINSVDDTGGKLNSGSYTDFSGHRLIT